MIKYITSILATGYLFANTGNFIEPTKINRGLEYIAQSSIPIAITKEKGIGFAVRELPAIIPLDDSASYSPNGRIVKCSWKLGDGKKYTESERYAPDGKFDCKTKHLYTNYGIYKATLMVKDNKGFTAKENFDIIILLIQFKQKEEEGIIKKG